jgi:hypothetical protein
MLYMTPRGRVANWTGWTILGLSKETWVAMHVNIAILFALVAVVHLILNWTMFWGYIKKRASPRLNLKVEMAIAAVLVGVVAVGAVCEVPPFSTVMTLNRQIKDSWESLGSDAPAPHAEEFTVERLATSMNLSVSEVATALQDEGFVASDASVTVGQIAAVNGVTPQEIYAAVRKRFPAANHVGPGAGKGFGPDSGDHKPGEGRGQGNGPGKGKGLGKGAGKGWRMAE